MTLVVDASVLVKLVLEESGSKEAREVFSNALKLGEGIFVPDIALSEAFNALWKHCFLVRDIGFEECLGAARDLLKIWRLLEVYSTDRFAVEALEVAVRKGLTFYDSLYLVLALELKGSLVSFDYELREKAKDLGLEVLP